VNNELLYEVNDGIAVITINRPERRNALSRAVREGFFEVWRRFEADGQAQVAILTGAGDNFCAGMDLIEAADTVLRIPPKNFMPVLGDNIEVSKPVIAAIDGFALGGGCELAMACDIRIATTRSKFGQPEVNLGIIPGAGGTQRLQRLVGVGKAKELIFTGEIISAQEAREIGLVNKVVEQPEALLPAAKEMAQKIIAKGPVAVSLAKMAINVGTNTDINSGLLFEKVAQTIAFSTDDRIEGTTAFLEKRQPEFKGR